MPNVINKVVYGGNTLIDLTSDTATADKVLSSYTFHLASGATATGSCTYDSDTSADTAQVAEVLSGKTFHARGAALEGTMPNRGAVTGTISDLSTPYTIQNGYHDGSGTVSIDSTSASNLIPGNVRENVTILGVVGTMSGSEDVHAQAKSVTPSTSQQTITPDSPTYNYLSQVTVLAIPYTETLNAAGGYTATIGGAASP